MAIKRCIDCSELKPTTEFYKDSRYKDGYGSYCKSCNAQRTYKARDKYRKTEKGKEAWKKAAKAYNESDKGKLRRQKYKNSDTYKRRTQTRSGKDKINAYIRYKRQTNPFFRLSANLRKRIGNSINGVGYSKKSKTYEILGIEYDEFRSYLEKQFDNNMNWDNYGEWHLDHIIPISSANNEEEVYKLNFFLNFQPMWAKDNISKSNKFSKEEKDKMLYAIEAFKSKNS